MITSKSPRMVARVALAADRDAFSDYSHLCSPRKFTQPQLFACLVLKEFDGVLAEVRADVNIKHVVPDAGFDLAPNHRLLRQDYGMLSTIPPGHGRPSRTPPRCPRTNTGVG